MEYGDRLGHSSIVIDNGDRVCQLGMLIEHSDRFGHSSIVINKGD